MADKSRILVASTVEELESRKKTLLVVAQNIKDIKTRVSKLESDMPNAFDKIVRAVKSIEKDLSALGESGRESIDKTEKNLVSRIREAEKQINAEIQKQNGKRDERIKSELKALQKSITDLQNEFTLVRASDAMKKDGKDGRGISSVFLRDNEVVVKFSDGSEESAGKIEVPKANDYFKNYGAFNRGRPGKSVEMYYETTDPTSSDGNDGALWVKYTE